MNKAVSSPTSLAKAPDLESLYQMLAPLSVGAGWAKPTPSLWPAPHKTFLPAHWSYEQGKAALDAAGRLIDTKLAERRNLILANPLEGNTYATVRTLIAAYQMILPGEKARSHRHTPNALRLIVDAEPGTYTVVDGEKLPMLPGDVLLTPNWRWHGHGNDGAAAAYWSRSRAACRTRRCGFPGVKRRGGWRQQARRPQRPTPRRSRSATPPCRPSGLP